MQRTGIIIGIVVCILVVQTDVKAQVITDKPSFSKAIHTIFNQRETGFDSIAVNKPGTVKGREAKVKIPGADECYINSGMYTARYSFADSATAIGFFKELQGLINESAAKYNTAVRFVTDKERPYFLMYHLADKLGFLLNPDVITLEQEVLPRDYKEKGGIPHQITNNPSAKPFVLYLRLNGDDNPYAGYTSTGDRLVNNEVASLIKEVGFGPDSLLSQIKKNKKVVKDQITYESKRTLKGYKATIYENPDEYLIDNVLYLVTQWKGKKNEEVLQKADSLVAFLKAALPDDYCYIVDNAEHTVTFTTNPFTTKKYDASFVIGFGLEPGIASSYYVTLTISRLTAKEEKRGVVEKPKEKKLIPFKSGAKYGYKNESGDIVVAPKYDKAADFREERALVVLNDRYGFIDAAGKEVIPLKYEYASLYFFNGTAEFIVGKKSGMLNTAGKEIVTAKYDLIDRNRENDNRFILVKLNGKFGFIDSSDREVTPIKYEEAQFWGTDKAKVKLNNLWGLIDKSGKLIVPHMYDYLHTSDDRDNEYLSPRRNKKYGLMDKTGKLLIAVKYDQVSIGFSENLCRVELNDKFGFVDRTGKEVIPIKFENTGDFSDGLAPAKQNGKWGFIDKSGKEVIAFKYNTTREFSQGLAAIELNNKWGFVDKTGKLVVPLQYDSVSPFESNGKAKVYIGKKWGRINSKGVVVEPIVNESKDDDDGW